MRLEKSAAEGAETATETPGAGRGPVVRPSAPKGGKGMPPRERNEVTDAVRGGREKSRAGAASPAKPAADEGGKWGECCPRSTEGSRGCRHGRRAGPAANEGRGLRGMGGGRDAFAWVESAGRKKRRPIGKDKIKQ